MVKCHRNRLKTAPDRLWRGDSSGSVGRVFRSIICFAARWAARGGSVGCVCRLEKLILVFYYRGCVGRPIRRVHFQNFAPRPPRKSGISAVRRDSRCVLCAFLFILNRVTENMALLNERAWRDDTLRAGTWRANVRLTASSFRGVVDNRPGRCAPGQLERPVWTLYHE